MKPLLTETDDSEVLLELGRASVQVVHDLKNQINGLKLYATFLRKRLEKAERPADELETLGKLIAGLERAAEDTSALVRYGRPTQLRRAPRTDLARLLMAAVEGAPVEAGPGAYAGEFDAAALTEALKNITAGARSLSAAANKATAAADGGELRISLRRDEREGAAVAVVEWTGRGLDGGADPFRSFAGPSGMRLALAAKLVRAHGGDATHEPGRLRVALPLSETTSAE
ncbi:MAG TPA: hypothetical protein VER08_01250 [Pyrinomonadaceae bacterium]|nr:hypothetical protein [Pyrinomonadaceae bacterium]